jgi:hexokinase
LSTANLTSTTGSRADVPKDWIQEIRKLEELFTVDTARLKKITDHFVSELEKGKWLRPSFVKWEN